MSQDLLIRNATLPDGRSGIDLLALDGRITALGPALAAPPGCPPWTRKAGC
jgi:cytosine deaminase